jgi:peptidoglycan/LPS O-acetylase OafA/YrhL
VDYRADIDGLRCVAILLVALFHFDLFPGIDGGFIGVDVFFVISGFLISSIIWRQLEAGRFTLGGFYLRRFRRLAPALICVQVLLLAFGRFVLLPEEVVDLARESLASQLYVVNIYFWRKVNYFGLQADAVPLLHFWSLAVEEQFYLLFPLFLMGVHRFARRRLAQILALVAAGSFLLNLVFATRKPELTFYLLPTRAWELALGALVPFLQPWFARRSVARLGAGLGGAALIAAGTVLYHKGIPFPGTFALLPTVGAVAILLAGTGAGSPVSRLLATPPFVFLGRISYSLYLVHWPLKVFVPIFVVRYSLGLRWASFALSVALAAVLYRLVEDPIRRGALFRGGRRFLVAYGVGFALVVGALGSALASKGWGARFSPEVQRIAAYAGDQDFAASVCEYRPHQPFDRVGPCHLGKADAPATWVVFGDSHAWALESAFSLFLQHRGEAGVLTFSHGCMPVMGLGGPDCQTFTAEVARWIETDSKIGNVALVSIWRQPLEGGLEGPEHQHLAGEAALSVFKQQLGETLRRLHGAGKAVYVWEPLVPARKGVPFALARNLAFGWNIDIETPRSEHEQTFGFLSEALDENRELVRARISPSARMCPGGSCQVRDGVGPLFFDNNHPARSQADFYCRIIESSLASAN